MTHHYYEYLYNYVNKKTKEQEDHIEKDNEEKDNEDKDNEDNKSQFIIINKKKK